MKLTKDFLYFFVLATGFRLGWHFGIWAVSQPEFFSVYFPLTCFAMIPVIFAAKNKLWRMLK